MGRIKLYLGMDFGTTGVRATVLDETETNLASAQKPLPNPTLLDNRPVQDPRIWWTTFAAVIAELKGQLINQRLSLKDIAAIAVDGTSGTMLLCNRQLEPVTPALMYNSGNFLTESKIISNSAPEGSIVQGENSALARLLFLQSLDDQKKGVFCMHQADWIAGKLMGAGGHSDENNVLKLGYNLEANCWPDFFEKCGVRIEILPRVFPVGMQMGIADVSAVRNLGFTPEMKVMAGTTDSNAAFLASGARKIGEGVTSLGTTLAIKFISDIPVQNVSYGIYSHRIGNLWLAGGASNSGGAALLKYFSIQQIETLSRKLKPEQDTGFDFYPLPKEGERFPINDPNLKPQEFPRPESDQVFLQALFEGIARIEAKGYALLENLGAPKLVRIFTSGGGSNNLAWRQIRSRICGVPLIQSQNVNPAYGSALLAKGVIPKL